MQVPKEVQSVINKLKKEGFDDIRFAFWYKQIDNLDFSIKSPDLLSKRAIKPFAIEVLSKIITDITTYGLNEKMRTRNFYYSHRTYSETLYLKCFVEIYPKSESKVEITISEERQGGPKGYFFGLYLKIENNIITKANFLTDGCGVMIATGSQTTILIKGHSIEFAEKLKGEDINSALMGLPNDEEHCLDLAIKTLKCAIEKYKSGKLI